MTNRDRLFDGDFYGTAASAGVRYDVDPAGNRFIISRSISDTTGQLVVWTDRLHEVKALMGG